MKKVFLLLSLVTSLLTLQASAQATDSIVVPATIVPSKFKVDAGFDILNNFIWRGIP